MIALRELKETDAPLMLEWMHDPEIQKCFKKDMLGADLSDAANFCLQAKLPDAIQSSNNLHFAIVDSHDEYLGTISLKEIDWDNRSAEYAIVLRKSGWGKRIAYRATGMLLKKAFQEYGLHRIYLNVLADNFSAIKLYERCGFVFEGEFRAHIRRGNSFANWKWYGMLREEYNEALFS